MTTDTPEPQPPDGPGAQAAPGSPAKAPRVLVSVDDFEDPAEWDVIVVENEAVDDETARRIARQRSARERRPRTITLPSLDERDVMQAFDTDRDAEDPESVSADAFSPPEPVPVRRRPTPPIPTPATDPFAGLPEPEPEPEPEAPAPVDDDAGWSPEALAPMAEPVVHRRPSADAADTALGVEPRPAEPVAPAPAAPVAAPPPPAAPAVATAPAAATHEAADPAPDHRPAPLDDPADDFYAIGDDEVAPAAAGSVATPEVGTAWGSTPEALDAPRDLLDDPADDFYDVGPAAEGAEERAQLAAADPAPVEPEAEAVGEGPAGDDTVAIPPPLVANGPEQPAPEPDADFEDELEFDSSYPLGPDDLMVEGELEPVDLDTLDYAAVFGPVRGRRGADPEPEPPRRRRPAYEDDLFLDEEEDEDDDDRYVVAPAKTRGRRRELVALGIAAGVMIAIGIGSQIYSGDDAGLEAGDRRTTTTRERVRATTPTSTDSALTLPSLPTDTSVVEPVTDDGGDRGGTTNTTRPRTTTTRRATTPPTAAPPTAPPQTTTTSPPQTTTTTAPPQTTTTTAPPNPDL